MFDALPHAAAGQAKSVRPSQSREQLSHILEIYKALVGSLCLSGKQVHVRTFSIGDTWALRAFWLKLSVLSHPSWILT